MKIDKEAQEYYAQLTAFYQQFRRIGNNYNQCVKTIHTIYGEKKSFAFLYKLAEETRKLEELCKQIIELTKRFEKEQRYRKDQKYQSKSYIDQRRETCERRLFKKRRDQR